MTEFITVRALGNSPIHWDASLSKALEVLFSSRWPTVFVSASLCLGTLADRDSVLAVQFALEIDNGEGVWDFFLLFFKMPLVDGASWRNAPLVPPTIAMR